MPAEYLECKKSYMDKGISEKVASARCAAMYYKRHGVTVNEAAKRAGESVMPEYDMALYDAIINASVLPEGELKYKGEFVKTEAVATKFEETEDNNIFEIVATKDLAIAFSTDGYILTWMPETLSGMAESWSGGRVTANHEKKKPYGKILASWYNQPSVHHLVWVNDEMAGWIRRNPEHIGVSIEADEITHKDGKIMSAKGTGVTFVFPPHTPGCSREEGCKVLGSDVDGAKLSTEERNKLPEGAFCGPDRSFPAHDAAHVRNGLARLSQSNFSDEEKKRIHGCLKRKAKEYGIEVSDESKSTAPEEGMAVVEKTTPTEEVGAIKGETDMVEPKVEAPVVVESAKVDIAKTTADLEAAKKTIAELEEYKRQAIAKEREASMSVIASYIDVTPYKEEHLCTLKAVASALEAYKKVIDTAPIKDSGAKVVSSDVEKPEKPALPKDFKTEAEYKQFLEAADKAKRVYGREIKVS